MDRSAFKRYLSERVVILDGATGTELQKRGMPKGVCPEQWVAENPEVILEVQREYVKAGSGIIYACTFGANKIKLEEFGLSHRTYEINKRLAELSKEAAGEGCLVAGDMSPTGKFMEPFGDMAFEECVEAYKEQIRGLLDGGVDLFVIETMMDIQEARGALLAVKEFCDLPVMVSMTFDEKKRTLTGTDPVTALITLQSMGADAVGCNCSTGPEDMLEVIALMKPYARVPLVAKPNAGLPKLVDGKTVFDMGAEEFGTYAGAFIEAGVNLIGGCCGTTPEYIRKLSESAKGRKPSPISCKPFSAVTSARSTVFFGFDNALTVIGERINPTGKKKLQEELRKGQTEEVRRFALEQVEKGALILDVNVGMPGIDEKEKMVEVVDLLSYAAKAPLCLDSSSPEVLEAALRIYPGRALINSISAEKVKLDRLLPIAAKYGAMFILLPLSDEGVPETAEERYELIQKVFSKAAEYGYEKNDMVVDGLVMTVSSNQSAALETLKVIEWCTRSFGCPTVVGLSNVSFGLPERGWVNAGFFAMAIDRGLTMAIANPSSETLMNIKMACDVLTLKDKNSLGYIAHFSKEEKENTPTGSSAKDESISTDQRVYEAVVKGNREGIIGFVEQALSEGVKPAELVDSYLIPAINHVGHLFDEKKYFLPQLIQSAESMKVAFERIEPLLRTGEGEEQESAIIVLATVKGDIHDIGKNIVGLMLKNYGFKVYDLGKDVGAELIVSKARELGAKIIGLSALMTTTMVEMRYVIELAKKEGIECKFMIGGAVVDEKYAQEIGADGYSSDAYEAVKLAQKLSAQ